MAKKKESLSLEEKLEQALVPDWEQPYKVPENWCWTRLPNICEYIKAGGDKPKNATHIKTESNTIPIIANGVSELGLVGYTDTATAESNTITVSARGTIGFSVFRLQPYYPIVRLIVIKPSYNISGLFLKYAFDNFFEEGTGSSIPQLTVPMLKDKVIPLPPLSEQHRIVARIESLFAKLDEAKELAQSALDSFETRKAAILHQAFTGELTKGWREAHGIGMESWEKTRFDKFCLLNRGFDLPSSNRVSGEYDLVTSSGVNDTHNSYKIKAPGVVTGRSGTIGKVFYIENDFWPLNTTLYAKNMYSNHAKYVYYYLLSFDFKNYSSSTAVPTLNRNNFAEVPVIVPTLPEQTEIVRILDSLFAKETQAKELTNVITQIDLMKKSILARAFRGELGTNIPEEESAVGLLKEILEEKI